MSSELQDRRPVQCVCSLCDCGAHNCANFDTTAATKAKTRAKRQQELEEDLEPVGRRQHSLQAKMEEAPTSRRLECELRTADAAATAATTVDDMQTESCRCLGDERYLGSQPGAPTKFKSPDELKALDDTLDTELMHVLVTRPEVASKPRDNIVFEGDMDLKTTFETSYEALAKMRLDHWRRYQESQEQQAGAARKPRKQVSAPRVIENGAGQQGVSVAKKGAGQPGLAVKGRAHVASKARGAAADETAVDIDDETSATKQQCSPSASASAGERAEQVTAAAAAVAAGTTSKACEAEADGSHKLAQRQQREHQPEEYARDIDPDLSPIIVYNANMNRLETVGLRRRSKYRPSTSLRAGAKGMFGDQEDNKNGTPTAMTALKQQQKQQASTKPRSTKGNDEPETLTRSLQRQMASESPFRSPEFHERTELSLNVRNLKDSDQGNYLTFTEYNLPVNSKRRVRNNVNMTDHIKEQNIVESSAWPARELESDRFIANDGYGQNKPAVLGDDCGDDEDNSESLVRLAQQEEEAAVEEIQLCTAQTPASGIVRESVISGGSIVAPKSKPGGVSQRRLKRTCQNQNFDISENEYPKQKYDRFMANGSAASARASPQTKHYNNLFSESPDFILTTGKFLDQEARGVGDKSIGLNRLSTVEPNESQSDSAITNDECRIFKLDDDFEYVGSRLGHRYYVEKHLNK